jgi:hypothetical protein
MRRHPNPPTVWLAGLTEEQQRFVIRLALAVVADLSAGRDWDAYGKIETARMELELKEAFWTLLDSTQRATIRSLAEVSHGR